MADEILRLGIDGRPAREGAAEVKRALDDVKKSAEGAAGAVDELGGGGAASGASGPSARGIAGLGFKLSVAGAAIGGAVTAVVGFRVAVGQAANVTRAWSNDLQKLATAGDAWSTQFVGRLDRVTTAFDRLDRLIDGEVQDAFTRLFDTLSDGDGQFEKIEVGIDRIARAASALGRIIDQYGPAALNPLNASGISDIFREEFSRPGINLPLRQAGRGEIEFRIAELERQGLQSVANRLRTQFRINPPDTIDPEKAERERFQNLIQAAELRRAETSEQRELLRLSLQYSAELEQGNLSLARRVELAQRLREIQGVFTPGGGIAGLPGSGGFNPAAPTGFSFGSFFAPTNAPGSVSLSPGNAAIIAGIQARQAEGARRAIAELEAQRSITLFTAGLDEAAYQLSQFSPEIGRFTAGVADFLSNIGRRRADLRADGSFGIEGALATIGIVGAGVGLAAQLGRALFGGGQEESPAQREARRIQAENNARLAELTQGIARLNGGVLGIAGSDFTRAFNLTDPFTRDFGTNGGSAGDAFRELVRATKAVNDNFGLLERVARSLGLEFDGSVDSIAQLNAALQTEFLSQFSNTFGGRFDLLQTRFGLLGTSPNDQFDALRREIQDLVSGDLGAQIGGLNRDNFRTFAAEFLDRLRAGDQSIFADLGDVSIEEFLAFLRAAGGALDGLEEAASSATDALRNVPEVFKVAASTFLASDSRDPIFRPVGTGGDGSRVNVEVTINTTGGVSEEDAVRAAQIVTDQILQSQRRGGTSAFDLAVTSSSRSGLKGGY